MKELIAMLLALVMVFALAACGASGNKETEPATEAPTEEAVEVTEEATEEATEETAGEIIDGEDVILEMSVLEMLLNDIIAQNPVEFFGGNMPVDLADADAVKYFTGLDSAENIVEAAVYEPMMGSIAFSMVAVRVAEGVDAEAVAEEMKNGIDTRKWICVGADELETAVSGDVVMLIMLDSATGLNAKSFVDTFYSVYSQQ